MINIDLTDLKFSSDSHIRYENGHRIAHQKNCNRGIRIQSDGADRYIVTIYNQDGNHPFWGDNVQMSPKQMKILSTAFDKVVLRGYGVDSLGNSFSDYAISIHLKDGQVDKCILQLIDRNILIEYLKEEDALVENTLSVELRGQRDIVNGVVNSKIAANIEKEFNTIVNHYGCSHNSESAFVEFGDEEYIDTFTWCSYFIVPIEYDYKVIMPVTYYKDMASFSPIFPYQFESYLSKLKSYDTLKDFIERFTQGATVLMTKIIQSPVDTDSGKIIPDSEDREGYGYLVLCYFFD